jgi:hypothetical protein
MTVICVNRGEAFFGDFDIDSGAFNAKVRVMKRVLGTFEWVEKGGQAGK